MISNYNRLPDVLYGKNRFTVYSHAQAVQTMGSTPVKMCSNNHKFHSQRVGEYFRHGEETLFEGINTVLVFQLQQIFVQFSDWLDCLIIYTH